MSKQAIVCVDDDATVLRSLKTELKQAFGDRYLIEMAEDGQDGIDLLQELLEADYEVPLIITDYIMPGLKGDEVLKQAHLLSPNTLKIMLTGQATMDAVISVIRHANLYRYIPKPWQAEDLRLTVVEALTSYHQNKELLETRQELIQTNQKLEQMNQDQATLIKELHENERRLKQFTDELFTVNQAFSRFVPRQFVQLLDRDSVAEVELGDQVEREMSVLFADIRGFTALSEQMTPEDTFQFINSFFRRMEPAIRNHNGFIDKYIGDAIMALFNASAEDALAAGITMLKQLAEYNGTRTSRGYQPIEMGIGINTGSLILGTVGSAHRIDTTVISDAVNLAARLEELTKQYGVSLVISQDTLSQLEDPDYYAIRLLDQVQVRGRTGWVRVFEVFDADPEEISRCKTATRREFEQAQQFYHQNNFQKAIPLFQVCLAQNPGDRAAQTYLYHSQRSIHQEFRHWRLQNSTRITI